MKKSLGVAMMVAGSALAILVAILSLSIVSMRPKTVSAAATCTPTNFYRDGFNLTAARINPSGVVSGDVDATGCDIGVYYGPGASGEVNGANIFNGRYFGVVNNGGVVNVENSSIHDIGDTPLDGDQHGVGVYWAYNSQATGKITGNSIWHYQKGGIVVNGAGSSAQITGNTVSGLGPVSFIAQNGIEVGYGASASVMRNTVTGASYTGTSAASGGILVFGGACYGGPYTTNVQVEGNIAVNNDVGIWLSNLDANCNAASTPTNIRVVNNTISSDGVYNNYGGAGYQAGIADQGDGDKLIHNTISGLGYNPATSATAYLRYIDADPSFTNNTKIHANVTH